MAGPEFRVVFGLMLGLFLMAGLEFRVVVGLILDLSSVAGLEFRVALGLMLAFYSMAELEFKVTGRKFRITLSYISQIVANFRKLEAEIFPSQL
jgi:hypothetical protein